MIDPVTDAEGFVPDIDELGARDLPEFVRAAMRTRLLELLPNVRARIPPSDGSMHYVGNNTQINGGGWGPKSNSGWTLQAEHYFDLRMHSYPVLIVHAYQGGCVTRGSLHVRVPCGPSDRKARLQARKRNLLEARADLSRRFDAIERELLEIETRSDDR